MVSLLIIVPTLDSCSTLPRQIASLQQQTWPYWRVLFIDGESGLEHQQWLKFCCAMEPRCSWVQQNPSEPGIFGAMNQGFQYADPSDWVLFWGSDDWAAGSFVLSEAMRAIESAHNFPDLIVCSGRYADASSGVLTRSTTFRSTFSFSTSDFRKALFFGSSPPHQSTLIGPGARRHLDRYSPGFRLSADLDYFLMLSRISDLCVQCLDLELVHMADGGVSGQQTQRRLKEVRRAYRRAFGMGWWFPFLMRYLRRVASLFVLSR